jgi:hypothetical protein
MRKLPERRVYFQPKVAQWWPSAKTIPHVIESKFGLEFLPPPSAQVIIF